MTFGPNPQSPIFELLFSIPYSQFSILNPLSPIPIPTLLFSIPYPQSFIHNSQSLIPNPLFPNPAPNSQSPIPIPHPKSPIHYTLFSIPYFQSTSRNSYFIILCQKARVEYRVGCTFRLCALRNLPGKSIFLTKHFRRGDNTKLCA